MSRCILIDNERLCFLKATPTVKQAEYWADILAPTSDFLVTGTEGKNYSCYTPYELRLLYYNTTGQAVPENIQYSKLIQGIVKIAKELILDETSVEDLEKKLGRPLKPVDPRPVPEKGGRKPNPGSTSSSKPVTRPKAGSATGKVWDIADGLYKASGEIPNRTEVVDKCSAEGINPSTASTQYGKWKKHLSAQG